MSNQRKEEERADKYLIVKDLEVLGRLIGPEFSRIFAAITQLSPVSVFTRSLLILPTGPTWRTKLGVGVLDTPAFAGLIAPYLRAASAAGLQLQDDAGGLGLFVADGGNVGVGTTDVEAWTSTARVLEWLSTAIMGDHNTGGVLRLLSNLYFDTGWKLKYAGTGFYLRTTPTGLDIYSTIAGAANASVAVVRDLALAVNGGVSTALNLGGAAGGANRDVTLAFATDASMMWAEASDLWILNKGVAINAGTLQLANAGLTQLTISATDTGRAILALNRDSAQRWALGVNINNLGTNDFQIREDGATLRFVLTDGGASAKFAGAANGANTDFELLFATDASLAWGEAGDLFTLNKQLLVAAAYPLILRADNAAVTPAQLHIQGLTDTNKRLYIGVNTTSLYGSIQAIHEGSGYLPLALNPGGGNVGIGVVDPDAKLEVAGQVKITGGTPGAGKQLTSDANGLASWVAPVIVADAPSDGNTYGRKDGAWAVAGGGSGLTQPQVLARGMGA